MNAIWIDEGASPDFSKLRTLGFTRLYFSVRQATYDDLFVAKKQGFEAGIYWASTWDDNLAPEQQAMKLSETWQALRFSAFVCIDIETHDPDAVESFIITWRRLRPRLATAWTFEGFQGGWLQSIAQSIYNFNVMLLPQCYAGDMTPFDVAGVLKDLRDYGVLKDLRDYGISLPSQPMHDASRLYRGWYGCAFTQARLP